MSSFSKEKADSFENPVQLPKDSAQQKEWLLKNKEWWEKNPMRYDWKEGVGHKEFSKEFYQEIDARFFKTHRPTIPGKTVPLDSVIDFSTLRDKTVLEIGVGNGTLAQLVAGFSGSYYGIDLTDYGVKSTSGRMEVFGIKNASIIQMNAEELLFEPEKFDFVLSWGVIHHSANTKQILSEIYKVMKPGARFTAMVYHRGYWNYYIRGFLTGLFKGGLGKGIHRVIQDNTDGAMARFYSIDEWRDDLSKAGFSVQSIRIMGLEAELIPLPGGKIKSFLLALIPGFISYFLASGLRMGSFIVSDVIKKAK
jgi:2-polyprenyl-3-methyl-5-hydroxy-6-metoxy-1,4-benzoquinol methylase